MSGSGDGTVRLWDPEPLRLAFQESIPAKFPPGGRLPERRGRVILKARLAGG
jgi:hypothetical protein